MSQADYVDEVIAQFLSPDVRGFTLPLQEGCVNAERDEYEKFCEQKYRKAVGCINYLAQTTRPDLSFAVCFVHQFLSDPCVSDWENVKHVLHYPKKTRHYALHLSKKGEKLVAFTDSDWATDQYDSRSISGYVVLLSGAAVNWRSRKQKTPAPATSFTHAEYVAMFEGVTVCEWIVNFLQELNQEKLLPKPYVIQCDNTSAINIAHSGKISDKTKHIRVK